MIRRTLAWTEDALVVYEPAAAPCTGICLLIGVQEADDAVRLCASLSCLVVCVPVADWNRALSPWPAPRAFRREADFPGGADETLAWLHQQVLPRLPAGLPIAIAGYSLAGLFALWAACESRCFAAAGSASGSLWYDSFLPYFREHIAASRLQYAYFSLGDAEPHARNPRFSRVGEDTLAAAAICRDAGILCDFQWNAGGHSAEVPARIAQMLSALNRQFVKGGNA